MPPSLAHDQPAIQSAPTLSALTSFIQFSNPTKAFQTHEPYHHHLASQVLHNLRHQHDWTALTIHTHSPLQSQSTNPLPRPLISGLPPQRIYIHPDEQVELLKQEKARNGARNGRGGQEQREEGRREREWVLPTHLREKWSLRKFAEVFDGVGDVPPEPDWDEVEGGVGDRGEEGKGKTQRRRGGKRVLLATVDTDSTIVYYIVHEGIVKPRQN
jgi:tRNA-splicing endonuclease subunit Sen15